MNSIIRAMGCFKNGTLAIAITAAAAFFGNTASAASCKFGDFDDFMLSADVYTSTDCVDQQSGNDDVAAVQSLFFGVSPVTQYKVDEPDTSAGILTIDYEDDLLSGTWSVSSWAGIKSAILVLKASNNWAAYLLDINPDSTMGGWSTQAILNNGGNQPAISHVSLYTEDCPPGNFFACPGNTTPAIPLPAGLPLLLSALGIGALMRMRTRKSA